MNYIILALILLPLLAAVALPFINRFSHGLESLTLGSTLVSLGLALGLYYDNTPLVLKGVLGMGLSFSAESLQIVLAVLAGLVFFFSALANSSYFKGAEHKIRYYSFFLLTQGALFGVFLSADLFTTFVFFEIMSLTSWVWVAQNETESAINAAYTYLAIAIGGGMVLLYGLFLLNNSLDSLSYSTLKQGIATLKPQTLWTVALTLTVGFAAKAGVYPLHIWLPKAHPEAPAPASSLLSGILTKSGIFGLLIITKYIMAGNIHYALMLLVLGTITMVLGACLALLTDNLKKALACSSLSQIGFITVAVALIGAGMDTTLAAGGALLHIINHALTKAVLFLTAGILYTKKHSNNLNDLKGSGRGNFILTFSFLIGGLSLAGVPGLAGYISKTLIHEALVENIPLWSSYAIFITEKLFLFSGGLTLAYMSKLFFILFVSEPQDKEKTSSPVFKESLSILLPALGLLGFGLFPDKVYNQILHYTATWFNVHPHQVIWFSPENLKGAAISLAIGAFVYLIIVQKVLMTSSSQRPVKNISFPFDLETKVYKPILSVLVFFSAFISRFIHSTSNWLLILIKRVFFHNPNPVIIEGTDDHFGLYSVSYVPPGRYAQTLALELMLFGIGLIFTLFYLFLINGI